VELAKSHSRMQQKRSGRNRDLEKRVLPAPGKKWLENDRKKEKYLNHHSEGRVNNHRQGGDGRGGPLYDWGKQMASVRKKERTTGYFE